MKKQSSRYKTRPSNRRKTRRDVLREDAPEYGSLQKNFVPSPELTQLVESMRLKAGLRASSTHKGEMGQFLTPIPLARLMASMATCYDADVRILDAGAGIGSLFAALVERLCQKITPPKSIFVAAYEIDPSLLEQLQSTMRLCGQLCKRQSIEFHGDVIVSDFLKDAAERYAPDIFENDAETSFTCAVLNPPYKKINTDSQTRRYLRRIGIETSNLYAGFVAASIQMLKRCGELIAITPRSFCNGPYFYPFRKYLLDETVLRRVHVFESRSTAFKDDDVLQENIIYRAVKGGAKPATVAITSSTALDEECESHQMKYGEVIRSNDPELFIHITPDLKSHKASLLMSRLRFTLPDLDLAVSTGRVVDFRAKDYLRLEPGPGTVPLIYSMHFDNGYVSWPKNNSRKPNAIVSTGETSTLLIPNENYVLTKRFSSKEERRRIVAVVYDHDRLVANLVGIENHINYFHRKNRGLSIILARGLAMFLNSTPVDTFFRQFNGHTQVNATDLRNIKYPSLKVLETLGAKCTSAFPIQEELDDLVNRTVFNE